MPDLGIVTVSGRWLTTLVPYGHKTTVLPTPRHPPTTVTRPVNAASATAAARGETNTVTPFTAISRPAPQPANKINVAPTANIRLGRM